MTARELPDSSSIHTCSYYCDRPACVKAQRDQMRAAMFAEGDDAQRVSEGMVMVPRVPTDAMIHAGANAPGMKALGDSSATMQARGYPLPAEAFVSGKGPLEQAWEAMIEAALAQRGRE